MVFFRGEITDETEGAGVQEGQKEERRDEQRAGMEKPHLDVHSAAIITISELVLITTINVKDNEVEGETEEW